MKRLLTLAVLALASIASLGATLNPIQLLNPAGSTSGQTIVSTGASSAPAWATVPLSGLSSIAANTVLANATGSTAAPAAFAMPSCSATGNALNWTGGSGFTCATGYAPLASPAFTGTASFVGATFSGGLVPSQTSGIVGTTTNNNVAAGSIGEFPAPTNLTNVSMTSGTPVNCATMALTAGDWEVSGSIQFVPAGTTTVGAVATGINTTSATFGGVGSFNSLTATMATGVNEIQSTPVWRISLASSGTAYLIGQATFGTSTMTCNGYIRARRPR